MRFFLGVHKYASILGLQGDMGGVLFLLIGMHLCRDSGIDLFTKRILSWDYQLCSNISHNIFNYKHKRECEIDNIKETLTEQFVIERRQYMLLKLLKVKNIC